MDDEFICISFFCPSEWWGIAALLGSYVSLGKAGLWEKTENGQIMADRFLKAYQMSREDEFMCKVTNEITVNVPNSVSNCCDSNTTVEVIVSASNPVDVEDGSGLPEISDPAEIPGYMEGITTVEAYNSERCRRANWVADKMEKNVNYLNTILTSIGGDFAESLSARFVLAFTIAMSDTPAPGFADVAGLAILIAPKAVSWFLSAAAPADISLVTGIQLDKASIVAHVHATDSASAMGDLNQQFVDPVIDALGVSDGMKELFKTYNSYVWGSRFGNWLFSNTEKLYDSIIPADYPITIPCGSPQIGPYVDWQFNTGDLQGWTAELDNAGSVLFAPTASPNNAPSATIGLVGYLFVSAGLPASVKFSRDTSILVTSDHGIGATPYRNGGTTKIRAEFSDSSFLESAEVANGINVSPLVNLDISSKAGLNLTRVEVTVNGSNSYTGRRMQLHDINIGNEFGNKPAGSVEQTN